MPGRRAREAAGSIGLAVLAMLVATAAAAAAARPAAVASGSLPTSACNDRATVSFSTSYSPVTRGAILTRVPISAGVGCASHSYELTVSDARRHRGIARGVLDDKGGAVAAVRRDQIDAATASVALVITG